VAGAVSQRHDPREHRFNLVAEMFKRRMVAQPAGRVQLMCDLVHVYAKPADLLEQGRRLGVAPDAAGGLNAMIEAAPQEAPSGMVAQADAAPYGGGVELLPLRWGDFDMHPGGEPFGGIGALATGHGNGSKVGAAAEQGSIIV
jgi:hypothetical protein